MHPPATTPLSILCLQHRGDLVLQVRRLRSSTGTDSTWIVVDARGMPVPAIDEFLGYLVNIESSPNTIRGYAYDLKAYWEFLAEGGRSWDDVTIDDLAFFVQFLRRPN